MNDDKTTLLLMILFIIMISISLHIKLKRKNRLNKDPITDLYNLSYMMEVGESYLKDEKDLMVLVFNICCFKKVNDTYGYMMGNKTLKQVGMNIKNIIKDCKGKAGRLGGDEFIAVVPNVNLKEANKLYYAITKSINKKKYIIDPDLDAVKLNISIGMAHTSNKGLKTMQQLLDYADLQMRYNKEVNISMLALTKFPEYLNKDQKYLIDLLAEKDMYSYVHSKYAVQYVLWILEELNYPEKEKIEICTGAWLHDIGKLYIKNNILRKTSFLSKEEYQIIQNHIEAGIYFAKKFNLSERSLNVIRYHHERWDGKGYPYGIKGKHTPIEGRIMQVADTFSAITIKRVYRKVMNIEDAIEEIKKNKGIQFDPEIVDVFIKALNKKGLKNKDIISS